MQIDDVSLLEQVFGDALTAPRAWLIARTRKGRTEYYQSLSTTYTKTTWTRGRETATGFATEGEAEEFRQTFRLGGEVVPNEVR
jgi:hypothetical protein